MHHLTSNEYTYLILMALTNKSKIKFGIFAIVVCFVIATSMKNWGPATANVGVEKYKEIIKDYKKNPALAKKNCPKIIQKLESGIPELQKNGLKDKVMLSDKLIADCHYYAQDYEKAAKDYRKMVKYEPQSAFWHFRVAQALFKAGKAADALPIIHLASQLSDNADIWLLKAEIQTTLNLPNNAIDSYQSAIKNGNAEQIQKAQNAIHKLSTR